MYVKMSSNPTTSANSTPVQSYPRTHFPKSENEITFGIPSAAGLLCLVVSYIGSLLFITDCSVGYNNTNVLGCL
jgi:hypothetical protein